MAKREKEAMYWEGAPDIGQTSRDNYNGARNVTVDYDKKTYINPKVKSKYPLSKKCKHK